MTVLSSTLPLDGGDRRDATARWMAETLEGWSLPGRLHRGWLPAVEQGLAADGPLEVALEYDRALGLVTVEVREPGGRVIVGLDDFLGPA